MLNHFASWILLSKQRSKDWPMIVICSLTMSCDKYLPSVTHLPRSSQSSLRRESICCRFPSTSVWPRSASPCLANSRIVDSYFSSISVWGSWLLRWPLTIREATSGWFIILRVRIAVQCWSQASCSLNLCVACFQSLKPTSVNATSCILDVVLFSWTYLGHESRRLTKQNVGKFYEVIALKCSCAVRVWLVNYHRIFSNWC